MEFVYHHRTQGRGGEGVHIASLIRALESAGHEVTLVSPPGVDPLRTAGATPVDKGAAALHGIQRLWRWVSRHTPQLAFEALELAYNAYAAWRLRPVLSGRRGAVFYERYAFFLAAGGWLARRRGHPVILEVNEVAGEARARGQVMVPLARWIEGHVFRRADALLCVSSFLAEEARRRGARAEGVHVVPNAIDPRVFTAGETAVEVRKRYGLDGSVVAGFLGWFDRWDRLDLLVDVAGELREQHPELRILLVGDGPAAEELRRAVTAAGLQGKVVLTGAIPRRDVPRHIAAMDIGVLPDSNRFGSPIVLFEMMAMGKAVVAPDIAPIRDVLQDGVTGRIIPPGDREALRRVLRELLGDREAREALGARARERVMAEHTWDANARRVLAVAREIRERRTGAGSATAVRQGGH